MSAMNTIAVDFGASSGRLIAGQFDGGKLTFEEIHRFSNDPVTISGHTRWDVLRLYHEIEQGLLKFKNSNGGDIASIGIDTWGVDFGLLDANGQLVGNPYHYRDERTNGMMEKVYDIMSAGDVYKETGIAHLIFNTLYQLYAMADNNSPELSAAKEMLFMPDLFAYFLTGEKGTEYTIASTGQVLSAADRNWSDKLFDTLNLPKSILNNIEMPGSVRGMLKNSISDRLGIKTAKVISVATHDTASAVVSVPSRGGSFAYLSSGTWSLMGIESDKPVITEDTLKWNFTNEGGIDGTYRILKNIMGLWIFQELKRDWDREGVELGFGEWVTEAVKAEPMKAFIEPDDGRFMTPGHMSRKINDFLEETGQSRTDNKAQLVRIVLESLALKYRWTIERLDDIAGEKLSKLHIVGGGTKNQLLNQMTANAIGRPVICGPVEATAIGNMMVQTMALGEVKNLSEIRNVVADSFETTEYYPQDQAAWDDAYKEYIKLSKIN